MSNITFYIDGICVSAESGMSVLDAALANDFYIPHLCSHPDLPAAGECGLCLVEIKGMENPVCACTTFVSEGMEVTTKSELLARLRRTSMELIMAGHPHDCTGCKAFGNCELQAMWQYLGVLSSGMADLLPLKTTNKISTGDSLIIRENDRCIQCGRCVRACSELRGVGVLKYLKKGSEVYIGTDGISTLKDTDCRFCSACVEVCPTGALIDQEGIFRADIPKSQALIPCSAECPAHTDIPEYIRQVASGNTEGATAVLREKLTFPYALSLVCDHKCEAACKRRMLNEPVSIRSLKRYAVENSTDHPWKDKYLTCMPDTGKKVAIIGSGICGLTAGFYLRKKGHAVTVFEEKDLPGGYMTYGIPEHRLPKYIVMDEIDLIKEAGVDIRCGQRIASAADLKKDYDAVLVAAGTSIGKKLNYLPGSDLEGVYSAVEVLEAVNSGKEINLSETVSLVGGGDVAFDVASSLIRLGKTVNVVCLEKGASQASEDERNTALEEGAILYDSHSNEAIVGENGKVIGLRVHKINGFSFDPVDRHLIEDAIPDSSYMIPCGSIVFAAGQATGLTDEFGLELNRFGYPIDPETGVSGHKTSVEGVFAAGDVIRGTTLLIKALQEGREAAELIDLFLGGDGNINEQLFDRMHVPNIGKIPGFAFLGRNELNVRDASVRKNDFELICDGYDQETACAEAKRCLQCDLRCDISPVRNFNSYSRRRRRISG